MSALTEVLICLRDLLYKAQKYGTRISFTDDLLTSAEIPDITEAVTWARDAACHTKTPKRQVQSNVNFISTFNVRVGKSKFMKIGEVKFTSDYADDICLFIGPQRLYLNRHLKRAFKEAVNQLGKYL